MPSMSSKMLLCQRKSVYTVNCKKLLIGFYPVGIFRWSMLMCSKKTICPKHRNLELREGYKTMIFSRLIAQASAPRLRNLKQSGKLAKPLISYPPFSLVGIRMKSFRPLPAQSKTLPLQLLLQVAPKLHSDSPIFYWIQGCQRR